MWSISERKELWYRSGQHAQISIWCRPTLRLLPQCIPHLYGLKLVSWICPTRWHPDFTRTWTDTFKDTTATTALLFLPTGLTVLFRFKKMSFGWRRSSKTPTMPLATNSSLRWRWPSSLFTSNLVLALVSHISSVISSRSTSTPRSITIWDKLASQTSSRRFFFEPAPTKIQWRPFPQPRLSFFAILTQTDAVQETVANIFTPCLPPAGVRQLHLKLLVMPRRLSCWLRQSTQLTSALTSAKRLNPSLLKSSTPILMAS